MDRALGELRIDGIPTNKEQQLWIIRDGIFRSGDFGTSYYETIAAQLPAANAAATAK
jgi:biotin carboxylase